MGDLLLSIPRRRQAGLRFSVQLGSNSYFFFKTKWWRVKDEGLKDEGWRVKDEGSVRMKTPRARAREALMSTGGKPKKSTPL